ncbi:hypothetical protein [uncultured Erythrobacter sp.]|uniref:hypothetical protein n=1 Tax=uncultured Erythrobacter sp. TaxID=263913 RepID=UPI002628224E|nr:hypothetical protein [uncultured Erythrobacter sp.]
MQTFPPITCLALMACAVISLSACVSSYTGPVEVTRFVAEQRSALGQGTITLSFPEEMENQTARNAFAAAVADELSDLGYTVILDGSAEAEQIATIRTNRDPIATAERSRGPVSIGVGGGTGGYGSGVGLGVGINLGGGSKGPRVMTDLSVRISGNDGQSLWEGRAQQPTSINSPYSDVEASARTLAAALFRDFPGGNGDTITLNVDQLQD